MAIQSAKTIVHLVVQDTDLKNAFIGGIHYFHNMIAHACLFLLKVTMKYGNHFQVNVSDVLDEVERIILLCKDVPCADYHVIRWIGKGLQNLLSEFRSAFCSGAAAPTSSLQQPRLPTRYAPDTSAAAFAGQSHYDPNSHAMLGLDGRYAMPQQAIFTLGGQDFHQGAELLDATGFRDGSNTYTSESFGECAGEYGANQWSQLESGLGVL